MDNRTSGFIPYHIVSFSGAPKPLPDLDNKETSVLKRPSIQNSSRVPHAAFSAVVFRKKPRQEIRYGVNLCRTSTGELNDTPCTTLLVKALDLE